MQISKNMNLENILTVVTDDINNGHLEIPGDVASIGNGACYKLPELESVTICDGVKRVGDFVFMNCENLTKVEIPNSVEKIGESCFSHCDSLESITIPNSVKEIGNFAFKGSGLKTLEMPAHFEKESGWRTRLGLPAGVKVSYLKEEVVEEEKTVKNESDTDEDDASSVFDIFADVLCEVLGINCEDEKEEEKKENDEMNQEKEIDLEEKCSVEDIIKFIDEEGYEKISGKAFMVNKEGIIEAVRQLMHDMIEEFKGDSDLEQDIQREMSDFKKWYDEMSQMEKIALQNDSLHKTVDDFMNGLGKNGK